MKELLLLWTRHVHFTFSGDIYIQLDEVAMGSPLKPLLANVSKFLLQKSILTTLKDCLVHLEWYSDDTQAYINPEDIDYVIKKLKVYQKQIQYTYEVTW